MSHQTGTPLACRSACQSAHLMPSFLIVEGLAFCRTEFLKTFIVYSVEERKGLLLPTKFW